jgi:hypothetical protein
MYRYWFYCTLIPLPWEVGQFSFFLGGGVADGKKKGKDLKKKWKTEK